VADARFFMRRLPLGWFLVSLAAAAGFAPLACGGGGDDPSGASGTLAGGTTGGGEGTTGIFDPDGGLDSLTVEPKTADILIDNGVATPPNVDFEALQGDSPVNAAWSVDFGTIADVDADGVVTASGTKGGEVVVTAKAGDAQGSGKVTVNLKQVQNPGGISPGDQGILKAASDPDPVTQWTYPYDKTVFPRGLLAPEMMWNNGGADDAYYIHLVGQFVDIEIFAKAPAPSRFLLDDATWKAVSESGKGGDLAVSVHRLVPGAQTATVVINHTWRLAKGSLRGTVYYWANSLGRVVRIKPGSPAPDDFLAAAGVTGCTTCHTVSANGETLIMGGDDPTSNFQLIPNTPQLALQSVGKEVRNWAMPAVSPNGKYVVENNAAGIPGPPGGSDGMFDAMTGLKLAGTGLEGILLGMPAFGPSGKHLAYVTLDGTHDLARYLYDSVANTVDGQQVLVSAGADPSLNAISFPSVSPTVPGGELGESTWIVYHRGAYPGSLDTRMGPGDLYLANADEPGIEVRLANANGDGYPFAAGDRDRSFNYEPTFAPVAAGGYLWVVFTSRRTYGNRLTGGKDQVKQLWVTAIDQLPKPGEDPSHPAFLVPGQDLATLNMRGFWAMDPCKQQGDMCTTDGECCNGEKCEDGLCGGEKECAQEGGLCEVDADCCDAASGILCLGGECGSPPPQ
jgi:hypothetical protein